MNHKGLHWFRFPSWLNTSSITTLRNLKRVHLAYWWNCRHLPPLGLLPNLESLLIQDLFAVESIGHEFMGFDDRSTRRMGLGVGENGFPRAMQRLLLLGFEDFPKLESLPKGLGQPTIALEIN